MLGALLAGVLHRLLLCDQGQKRVPEPGRDKGKGVSQTQPSPDAIRRLAYEISDMKTSNALRIKLLSPKGKLPVKGTSLAAGYDLSSA